MSLSSKWFLIIRHLGLGWVLFRVWYAFKLRVGFFVRRGPVIQWSDVDGGGEDLVFIVPGKGPGAGTILADAERIVGGKMRLYFRHWVRVGESPDWHRNLLTGEVAPRGVHWSRLGDFDFGDIKNIWEPSRFGWAFTLAQAYYLGDNEIFAERFWQLFESWLEANPPNEGVNWKCGQECALRLMAVCYARDLLCGAKASTAERLRKVRQLAVATADRIDLNLSYALSQKNNHGVSECVGLVTAGLMLPDHPRSVRWLFIGMRNLRKQLDELLYPDGGFSQHSVNYHRVVLENLIWASTILEASGKPAFEWLRAAGERATRWLALMTDATSGASPCFGSNDGAWILPLSAGGYADCRPTVQAGALHFCGQRAYADRTSDDHATWLGVAGDGDLPDSRGPFVPEGLTLLTDSGLGVFRSRETLCVMRSMPKFRHRMGHIDMLHVSLIAGGRPIVLDAGSYSYNPQGSKAGLPPLSSSCYHNGPRLAGVEPVKKVSRFLALPWPKGELMARGDNKLTGSHDGYWKQGQLLGRTIVFSDDGFQITDATGGDMDATLEWYWLFPDVPYEINQEKRRLVLQVGEREAEFAWDVQDGEATVVVGDETSFDGWASPYYQQLEKAIGLRIRGKGPAGFRLRMKG